MAVLWRPPEEGNQGRGSMNGGNVGLSQLVRGYGVLPASPCVVKNTFLHVVGEDNSEAFDAPPSPRRQMSEPPKLRHKEPDLVWHAEELPTDQDGRQPEDHDSLNDVDLRVMSGLHDSFTASTCAGSRQDSSGSDDRFSSDRYGWQGLNEALRYLLPPSSDAEPSTSTWDVRDVHSDSLWGNAYEPDTCESTADLEKETGSVSESTAEPLSTCQDGGAMAATPPSQAAGRDRRRRSRTDPMSWDDVVVTVMVRQIPRQFTQLMFLKEVKARGFDGLFDFLYLPFDLKKGINVGYGFLSFIEATYAQDFRREFDGIFLDKQMKAKGKPLRVHPANVQGYEANYQQFMQTQTGQKQDPQFSPLFLRPGASLNPNSEWGRLAPMQDAPPMSAKTLQVKKQQQQSQCTSYGAGAMGWCPETSAAAWCRGDGDQLALDTAGHLLQSNLSPHAEQFHPGNWPSACRACGAPFGAKHNFCSACGAQVANRVVFTPAPNLGFHGAVEGSAKLFQDLETERNRLAKELAHAQAEGHRRAAGQTGQQPQQHQQQHQQTQHNAAAAAAPAAPCPARPIMLGGLLYPDSM